VSKTSPSSFTPVRQTYGLEELRHFAQLNGKYEGMKIKP
jgi:hypothetical protein